MLILLAIALSVDALGIGISYSIRGIKVPLTARCVIFGLSVLITGAALLVGQYTLQCLNPVLSKAIGMGILFCMGAWILFESRKDNTDPEDVVTNLIQDPTTCDFNRSKRLDPSEAFFMGIALSVDSIGAGIGSGITGWGILIAPLLVGFFQMLFLYIGEFAGKKMLLLTNVKNSIWGSISGIILIVIAFLRLFN